jgi:hypothetical protein
VVAELGAWVAVLWVILAGFVASFGFSWLRPRLTSVAPVTRERILLGWALAPWILGALVTVGCFLPSLRDWLGGAPDHCGVHGDHHLHLCFHHAGALERSAAAGALGGLVLLVGLSVALAVAVWAWRYLRLVGGLAALSEPDPATGTLRIATRRPLALTLGLLRPQVFLSEGLEEGVPAEDLDAVRAHEAAHVLRRDGLRKLALATFTLPYPPSCRVAMLEEYAAVCEELCDVHAARVVGEPARVARALLSVARLGEGWDRPLPAPACRFSQGHVERRVRALLEPIWPGRARSWVLGFAAVFLCVGVATGMASGFLHHGVESALELVF